MPYTNFYSSLLAGQFSDITITQGPNTWKAHKVVVCSQSAVLGALINKLEVNLDIHYYCPSLCHSQSLGLHASEHLSFVSILPNNRLTHFYRTRLHSSSKIT